MKRIFLSAAVIALMFCVGGCPDMFTIRDYIPEQGAAIPEGYGAVRLSIVRGAARTAMPSAALEAFSFEYFFEKDGGRDRKEPDADGIFLLEPGEYLLEVAAYLIKGENNYYVASGETSFTVSVGSTTNVTITLSPFVSGDGQGTILVTLNCNVPDYTIVELLLTNLFNEQSYTLNAPDSPAYPPAGYYLLRATLYNAADNTYAIKTQVVHIYQSMTTTAAFTFTSGEFISAEAKVFNGNDEGAGSLRYVIANAPSGSTVTIDRSVDIITLTSAVTIPEGRSLAITSEDAAYPCTILRGFNGNSDSGLFMVESGAGLTLGNVIIDGDKDEYTGNYAPLVYVNGGAFTMNVGAKLRNNKASGGGGVYVSSGTFTMNGGEIYENTSDSLGSGGGGVYVNNGTFIMIGGEIYGNTSASIGGGVEVYNDGTFTMSGGEISGNTAADSGGGVSVWYGSFTMNDGKIFGNTAVSQYGGGVLVASNAAFAMKGGEISGNTAPFYGGGVMMTGAIGSYGTFNKTGGTIYGYEADKTDSNKVIDSNNTILSGRGHAVFALHDSLSKFKDTIAGEYDNLTFNPEEDNYTGAWDINLNVTTSEDSGEGSLRYVIENAPSVSTIIIPGGMAITLRSAIHISNKSLTITSAGVPVYILRGYNSEDTSAALFNVYSAELALANVIIDGQKDVYPDNKGSLITVRTGGLFTMNDGAVLRNSNSTGSGVVYVSEGTLFTMNGGEISGNNSCGVHVFGGAFTMNGGKISGNTAGIYHGGGLSMSSGTFNMTGGEISGNTSVAGGGVYIGADAAFTMIGGTITGNTVTSDIGGGGVLVWENAAFTVGGTAVVKNNNIQITSYYLSNNVFLHSGGYIALSTTAPLQQPAEIWVQTLTSSGVIVQSGAAAETAGYFHPDDESKAVAFVSSNGYDRLILYDKSDVTPGLSYELIANGSAYSVRKGTVTSGAVVIPAEYNGLPVTEIGVDAFWGCEGITSITIPTSVTYISNYAFARCNLTAISIPASVNFFSYFAFFKCADLTDITVDADNPNYSSEGGILYNKDRTELIAYPSAVGSVTIPSGVTIGTAAFYGCEGITGVTIPNSVTSIPSNAFCDCPNLTTVTIPETVRSIGSQAFGFCPKLTGINIPASVTEISNMAFDGSANLTGITVATGNPNYTGEGGILYNKDRTGLLAYPSAKGSVTIPAGVTSIGNYAFSHCYGLTGITIPAGVTSIGASAFYVCTGITDITIPSNVTFIGAGAFTSWTSAQTIYILGYANRAETIAAEWDSRWDEYCYATIVYYGIDLVWVPGGSFEMGKELNPDSGYTDVNPVHTVTLTGFYIGKYEVTQAQYQAVMGLLPNFLTSSDYGVGDNYPVYYVSWYEALVFCNKLSIAEGLTPAYRINGSTDPSVWGSVPEDSNAAWDAVEVVSGSTGYRLPTEAQWEYAAKGGGGTPGNFTYAGSNTVDGMAWYSENSGAQTHEVATKTPNGLSLCDMSGNVGEWCWDWYGSYTSEAQTDPGGASSGSYRVYRGGSLYNSAADVRSVYRGLTGPYTRDYGLGFRVVRP